MGLAQHWDHVDDESPGLPMVGMVAAYQTLSGEHVEDKQMDLRVRLIFMNRLHESIAGSGSVCLAAASRIPASTVAAVAENHHEERLIGHPSGVTPAKVDSHTDDGHVLFDVLGFSRTARRLMDGTAYYPGRPERSTDRTAMPTTQTNTTITDIAAEAAGLSSFMLRGQLVELLDESPGHQRTVTYSGRRMARIFRSDTGPAERLTIDQSMRMALLVVLETMTPVERVAFVYTMS